MAKDKCDICKKVITNWTDIRNNDFHVTLCPTCLMWSGDTKVVTARSFLRMPKAQRQRAGIEITYGGAEDGK